MSPFSIKHSAVCLELVSPKQPRGPVFMRPSKGIPPCLGSRVRVCSIDLDPCGINTEPTVSKARAAGSSSTTPTRHSPFQLRPAYWDFLARCAFPSDLPSASQGWEPHPLVAQATSLRVFLGPFCPAHSPPSGPAFKTHRDHLLLPLPRPAPPHSEGSFDTHCLPLEVILFCGR